MRRREGGEGDRIMYRIQWLFETESGRPSKQSNANRMESIRNC